MNLTFATRKSALALAQSRAFAQLLAAANPGLELTELHITTSGDRFQTERLQDIGGKGLFIKELEEALLEGKAQCAVHSIKDVPAELVPGLFIGCIPEREDPRDVLVTKGATRLEDLPEGALVGTSSLRRELCLRRLRPDLRIEALRGNVDTRLRKVEEGPFDAVVLAFAGLKRLGLAARASIVLEPSQCLPAIGQGALGVECREGDDEVLAVLRKLEHEDTSLCVSAERALMAKVGGNCRMPIAAYARKDGADMLFEAFVADADGSNVREGSRRIPWPSVGDARRLGDDLGAQLAKKR